MHFDEVHVTHRADSLRSFNGLGSDRNHAHGTIVESLSAISQESAESIIVDSVRSTDSDEAIAYCDQSETDRKMRGISQPNCNPLIEQSPLNLRRFEVKAAEEHLLLSVREPGSDVAFERLTNGVDSKQFEDACLPKF